MNDGLAELVGLLRTELTAVHQQFFHILALRQWDEKDILDHVTAVDTEDFKNVMQIIDLLVSRNEPVALASHAFAPGSTIPSILSAELRMERRLAEVLGAIKANDPEIQARVKRAEAPRRTYREWLETRIDASAPRNGSVETNHVMAEFLAHLIALVEQPMLHAFMFRHLGRNFDATNAWRLSGAAMLYGTALVRRGALMRTIPTPARIPAVKMASDPSEAFASDISIVRQCSDLGREAVDVESDDAVRRICIRIIEDCDLIVDKGMNGEFPAVFGRSRVFEDFAATCERHLH